MVCQPTLPIQKIALLFLTLGPVFNERLWELWLQEVNNSIPALALRYSDHEKIATELKKCNQIDSQWQVLYSLYAHPKPQWKGYQPGSLLYGTEVSQRVETKWATHSLSEALRVLLRAALQDAQNRRFVLLSDSSIPLYPAPLVYLQLTSERRSRLNACSPPTKHSVWHYKLAERSGLQQSDMRKSSQWVALVRKHAEVVVNDTVLAPAFEACVPGTQTDPDGSTWWSYCTSDEVYVPTLLSHHHLGSETTCCESLHHIEWPPQGGSHPSTFSTDDVTADRLQGMREPHKCKLDAALSTATPHILKLRQQDWASATALGMLVEPHVHRKPKKYATLDGCCPLFARKFGADTTEQLVALFSNGWDGMYDPYKSNSDH